MFAATAVIAAVSALSACSLGTPPAGEGTDGSAITVGSLRSSESVAVAQVYGQMLADAGYTVDYNYGVGSRTTYLDALQEGVIDVMVDYSGQVVSALDDKNGANTTAETMTALEKLIEPLDLRALDPAPGENSTTLVVTKKFSEAHNLATVSDLAPLGAAVTIGGQTGFDDKDYGRYGLGVTYEFTDWSFSAIDDDAERLQKLEDNNIQVAVMNASEYTLASDDLVELEDDRGNFAVQNVVPIVTEASYTDALAGLLNSVSAKLTTGELRAINKAIWTKPRPLPETVAADWLAKQDLLAF